MSFICVICRDPLKVSASLSELQDQFSVVATKCGHLYHFHCLSNWFRQGWSLASDHPKCPNCKRLTFVHELLQIYPAEESDLGDKTETQCRKTEKYAKVKENYQHLVRKFQDLESPTNVALNKCQTETEQELRKVELDLIRAGMDKLSLEFDELKLIQKTSEIKWKSVVQSQRRDIIELKKKNQQLLNPSSHNHKVASQLLLQPQEILENESIARLEDDTTISSCGSRDMESKEDNDARCWEDLDDPNFCETEVPLLTQNFSDKLRLGDKIVWTHHGRPETGIMRWKGFVGSRICGGIEFERQLGIPIGDLHTDSLQYIFKFKPGHGRLVPVDELVLFEDFYTQPDLKFTKRSSRLKICTQQ